MSRNNRTHDKLKSAYRKDTEQNSNQQSQAEEDDQSIREILGVDMSYEELVDRRLKQRRREIREKYTGQR